MRESTPLTRVSNSVLSNTAGNTVPSTEALAPLLQGLMEGQGWHDQRGEILARDQQAILIIDRSRQAAANYDAASTPVNRDAFIAALADEIAYLNTERDAAQAQQRHFIAEAEQAAKAQQHTNRSQGWDEWIISGLKSWISSPPEQQAKEQAQYYAGIATKRQAHIDDVLQPLLLQLTAESQVTLPPLMDLGEDLAVRYSEEQTPAAAEEQIEDIISPLSRRLLQLQTGPETTQYCYPTGACELSSLYDGVSGFVLLGEAASDLSGQTVSSAGDINGDGLADILVGAPYADPAGRTNAGKTYVVFGSNQTEAWGSGILNLSSLINGQRGFVLQGETAGDQSSYSVSSAGDINGDSLDDILIGALYADSAGRNDTGKSYVVFGSNQINAWGLGTLNLTSLMDGQRGFVLLGEAASDLSGQTVSSAGDINGDGLADILVGAPYADPAGRTNAGKTYVVFGSNQTNAWSPGVLNLTSLMSNQRGFVLQGEAANDLNGYSVSSAGDINGDGFVDIITSSVLANSNSQAQTGKSYVVFGSNQTNAWVPNTFNVTSLMNGQRGFVLQGEMAVDHSGFSVSNAGDINGDGLADILIGARLADSAGRSDMGKSYVVFGSNQNNAWGSGVLNLTSLMNGQRGFVLQGEAVGDQNGYSVSNVGDINSDGLDDVLVGAIFADPAGRNNAGKSYVVFGSNQTNAWGSGVIDLSTLMDTKRGFVLQGEMAVDFSGVAVSGGGDINGDGLDDIVIGATAADANNRADTGKVYVVFGDGGCQFLANEMTVYQGVPLQLSSQNFDASYAKPIRYNITAITHGQFEYVNNPGQAITFFNQTQIGGGQVRFVPDGSAIAPSYTVQIPSASKIVTFLPQNATIHFYEFFNSNQLTLHQGESVVMNGVLINGTSAYPYPPAQINITISNLQHGQFVLMPLNNSVQQFLQSELLNGQVLFVHDNSALTPSYDLITHNPVATLSPSTVQVTFYRRPVWLTNQLTVAQGQSLFLGVQNINVTQDAIPEDVSFTINNLQYGQFQLAPVNTTITTFTQQQVLNSQVRFVHDKTDNAPSYQLSLDDGYFTLPPESAVINFTPLPPLLGNNSLSIMQGRNKTLSAVDLSASDINPAYNVSTLMFTVSDVQHGWFSLQNNATAVTQFTQAQVINGQVVFSHDDAAALPDYKVSVSNAKSTSTPQAASIKFDARPVLFNNRLAIESGQSVVLAITDLRAIDDITLSSDLLFRVSNVQHGYFSQLQSPNMTIVEFVQQRIRDAEIQFQHDGGILPPSYTMTVTDGSGLQSFPQNAHINFKPIAKAIHGLDLQTLYTSVSSIGGIAIAIAGYLWLRRKTTAHRRGFELANNLRKAANLEYHDFMRFDGDVFKSKIENFLSHVDTLQKGFYKGLTPAEKKSFAVCITEILEQRNLLKPSGYGMGIYGWMFAFSVGWSQQLDFKKFEAQLTEIAQESVTVWKAEENPTTRWPYFSPTTKDKAKAFCCARPSRAGMFARDKVRLSRSEGVSLTDLKDSKHQVIEVSSSSQKDVLAPTTATSSSPRFFDSSTSSQERASFRQEVTSQFKQVAESMQDMQRGIQEVAGNVKTVNEEVEQLKAETRLLLRGISSSSS